MSKTERRKDARVCEKLGVLFNLVMNLDHGQNKQIRSGNWCTASVCETSLLINLLWFGFSTGFLSICSFGSS